MDLIFFARGLGNRLRHQRQQPSNEVRERSIDRVPTDSVLGHLTVLEQATCPTTHQRSDCVIGRLGGI